MTKNVNWIHNHTKTDPDDGTSHPIINLKTDNFLEKVLEKPKKYPYKSTTENKNRKFFSKDSMLEENIFNLAVCFFNSGHDCIKQRFTNFMSLKTVVIPSCVNLFYCSKLMMQYILNKFRVIYSEKDTLCDLFKKLPSEIKEFTLSQTYVESSMFLEIISQDDFFYYFVDHKKACTHINFYLRFCNSLNSVVYSIKQNLYFL